eukprot:986112-Karenia_brevis.AAC.1
MVKQGIPAHVVANRTPTRQRLWETGRLVDVVVSMGSGHQAFHIMSVWGYAGANVHPDKMAANERLLINVLEVAAELGSVPCVICGDFNVEQD